jgi:thiol-disulfide isomerase/thioredoxin
VSIVNDPRLAAMTVRDRLATCCVVMAVAIAACGAPGSAHSTAGPRESATMTPTPELGGSQAPTGPVLDQPWATVPLTDVTTGDTFQLVDHAGKVIIIETMAIWCPNCLVQEREVDAALGRLDPDSVIYIVLDVDLHEDAAALASYQAEYGFAGSFVVSGIPMARALAEEFGANVLNPPLTPIVIVGTDGTATLTEYGHKSADEIVALAEAAGA